MASCLHVSPWRAGIGSCRLVLVLVLLVVPPAFAEDLVVDGVKVVIDSDRTVDGSVFIQNGGELELRDATLTLQLDFDEEHHIDISDNSKLEVDNGIITSTGGQYWIELSGDPGETPVMEVRGASSWITNHSGIRPFDSARVQVTGGDVEELQVRDQVRVDLSDAATYPVFFFDGVSANLTNLDTGPSITNTVSVPGAWSFDLVRAVVEGYQIDLMNGADVTLDSGDGIVVSLHTPGTLGDQLQIVDHATSDVPFDGAITNIGSSFVFTDSNIALINVYTFGTDRVLLRESHVNEVNAEQTSELVIGQKGYATTLNCNLCQVYDRATFTVVEATIDGSENLPSATSSYADFDPVGRGLMRFVNMDLRALDLTAREQGTLELVHSIHDPARLDIEDSSATVSILDLAAGFTATRLSGDVPLTVGFLDQSGGMLNSWEWDFGDGGGSTTQNPQYTYTDAGTYAVSLEVTGTNGTHAATKTAYIQVTGNGGDDPVPPAGAWLTSAALPGFRAKVRITAGSTIINGEAEDACIPETLCVSGAVAGRSEVFIRVVGPKPNGYLWPTLVKFSTSQVEIWLEQTSTGKVNYYLLAGARPGFDELPGMFDRLGFRP